MTGYLSSIGGRDRPWTTASELDYLKSIGRHSAMTVAMDRAALLRNYRGAALRRHRWGDLDRERVLKEVDLALLETTLTAELEATPCVAS